MSTTAAPVYCRGLDKPEGAELVRKLVAKADIFMCNLLTARQQKFGLDPDTLFNVNPKLQHATLTGYGTTGPDAWRPGYDVTAFLAAPVYMMPLARAMTALCPWHDPPKVITPRAWLWWARFLARCAWPKSIRRPSGGNFTLRNCGMDTGHRLFGDGYGSCTSTSATAAPNASDLRQVPLW